MPPKPIIGLLLAASALAPAIAQDNTGRTPQEEYQRGYATTPMPDQAAADAQSRPAVRALNAQGAATAQAGTDAQAVSEAQSQANQAQYAADRAAYEQALMRHDARVDRTNAHYMHQQQAYADAMAVWRVQVQACKHGHQRACDMPPPNPADYY